ncbi:MAG: TetR/AcrR family transcriptional regulator [Solirubrobacterales bacterium]
MPIEVRREQVLDAALRLITERGYGAVTMEAVAREADLAKPVVYNAYRGRAALLYALLEREEARALGALAGAMPAQPLDADPAAALLEWLRSLAGAIAANPAPWRLMLVPADETPDVVRERVQRGRALALEQAKSLTKALLAQRPPITSLDHELAAHSLLAICEQMAALLISEPHRYPPERLIAYAENLLRMLGLR